MSTLIERLNQIAVNDWRTTIIAHTSDTAEEAAAELQRQASEIKRLQGLLSKLQLNGAPNRKERRAAIHSLTDSDRRE